VSLCFGRGNSDRYVSFVFAEAFDVVLSSKPSPFADELVKQAMEYPSTATETLKKGSRDEEEEAKRTKSRWPFDFRWSFASHHHPSSLSLSLSLSLSSHLLAQPRRPGLLSFEWRRLNRQARHVAGESHGVELFFFFAKKNKEREKRNSESRESFFVFLDLDLNRRTFLFISNN